MYTVYFLYDLFVGFRLLGIRNAPFELLGRDDSVEEFNRLKRELTDTYGRLWFPFYEGSFEEVKKEFASRDDPDTILLIYFHASENSSGIVKQILISREASLPFDDPNVICWMADAGSNYQYQELGRKLGYRGGYPTFLFFSDFKGKLKLECSISGDKISASGLLNALNETKSMLTIRSLDADVLQKSETQILRDDQDIAYQMSLAADKQKREEALRRQEADAEKFENEKIIEEEQKRAEQLRLDRIENLKRSVVPEPPEGIAISTQLLDGKRVNRRFSPSTAINVLFLAFSLSFIYLGCLQFLCCRIGTLARGIPAENSCTS